MIKSELIKNLIEEAVVGTAIYLVDLKISADNKITVFLDTDTRITIDQCAMVSRFIEDRLNRDEEDYELTVSSPGLDEPFKHLNQYKKRIGCQVAIVLKDGQKVVGKLTEVGTEGVVVELKSKEKVEGKKSRQTVIESLNITFNQIKETKLVLTF